MFHIVWPMIAGIRCHWKILKQTLARVYCKQPECIWCAESCEIKQEGWLMLLRFSASGDAFVVCRVCCDCHGLTATQPFPSSYSPGVPLSLLSHSINQYLLDRVQGCIFHTRNITWLKVDLCCSSDSPLERLRPLPHFLWSTQTRMRDEIMSQHAGAFAFFCYTLTSILTIAQPSLLCLLLSRSSITSISDIIEIEYLQYVSNIPRCGWTMVA